MSIGLSNINRPMQSKFRIRSLRLFLTYPQCPIKKEEALTLLENLAAGWQNKIKNYVIAEETHMDGSPHLHAYLQMDKVLETVRPDFADLKAINQMEVMNYHGNYQSVRSVQNVIRYCAKKDDYITNFRDDEMQKFKKISKTEMAMREAMDGRALAEIIDENPTLLTMIGKIQKALTIYKSLKADPPKKKQVCGKWIFGPTGMGKSHFVREMHPEKDIYLKGRHKWWDNYAGQPIVLIEEMTPADSWMFAHLLVWTDKWEFNAETKGDGIVPKFRKLYITSNYSIDECFAEIPDASKAALRRRFVVLLMESKEDWYWEKPALYEDSTTQQMMESWKDRPISNDDKPDYDKYPDGWKDDLLELKRDDQKPQTP